jgi:hypothetical protein
MRAGDNSETARMVTSVLLFGVAGYGIWRSLTAIHYLALAVGGIAGGLATWLSDRREGDATLAIGPEGIWVAERNWVGRMRGRRIIPWSDVRKVYSSWVFGEIVMRAREKDARLAWRDVFGSSTHNMAGPRCAKLINTYWERTTGGA